MSDKNQFKSFTTRKFRADLHYRLKLLAAMRGCTMEDAFNDVVDEGLKVMERETGKTAIRGGRGD